MFFSLRLFGLLLICCRFLLCFGWVWFGWLLRLVSFTVVRCGWLLLVVLFGVWCLGSVASAIVWCVGFVFYYLILLVWV